MREDALGERVELIEGEDFYREGAAIVFTARYHLRRGYCCGSGCRHCPYGDASDEEALSEAKGKEGARCEV